MKKSMAYYKKFRKFIFNLPEQSQQMLNEMRGTDKTMRAVEEDMRGLTKAINLVSTNLVIGIIIVALIIGAAMLIPYDEKLIIGIPSYSFFYISLAVLLMLFMSHGQMKKTRR